MLGVQRLCVTDEEQAAHFLVMWSGSKAAFLRKEVWGVGAMKRELRRSWGKSYSISAQKMPTGKRWFKISS